MKPEPIGAIPSMSLRALRMRRACEAWLEVHPSECPLDVLAQAAADHAEALGRDLTAAEIASGCAAVVASWTAEQEQQLARQALSDAREQERLRYLAGVRRDLLLLRSDPPPAPGRLTGADRGRK